MPTEVSLSDGEKVYFHTEPDEVGLFLEDAGLVRLPSGRYVNASQVTQIVRVHEVSSIHTPERLAEDG